MEKKYDIKLIILVVIILGLLGFTGYQYYQLNIKEKQTPTTQVTEENTDGIVEEVSKVILLPQNEDPTIAIVKDVESLSNQPIFLNAKNNDVLLIYIKAKKAILYRPSEKKIIDVGPVNISDDNTTGTTPENK